MGSSPISSQVRGKLIAIEGIDGSGKSTQAKLLADKLSALETFEPGASQVGQMIRSIVLSRVDDGAGRLSDRTEALLMVADRAQHVLEVIEPALRSGRWVVTDRFSGSTIAYQGFGRGLDVEFLRELSIWSSLGLEVDLNILIDVPVETALERRARRGTQVTGEHIDRIEIENVEFQDRVRNGFLSQSQSSDQPWVVIDGTFSVEDVSNKVYEAVANWFGLR